MSVLLSVLLTLRTRAHSRTALQLEILALRHQLQVLQRTRPGRLRLSRMDRCLWAMISRIWTGWRTSLVIVKPETAIAWHRRGFRLWWTWKSRRRIGRPTIPADVRALIRTMAQANPRRGAPRIHGELLKLGFDVGQRPLRTYIVRRRQPPSQTWRRGVFGSRDRVQRRGPTATDDPLLFVPRTVPHAPVAEQRHASSASGHTAQGWDRRGHPAGRWTPSSLRTARSLNAGRARTRSVTRSRAHRRPGPLRDDDHTRAIPISMVVRTAC